MRAEELKGHLDALLLAALEGGPRHGYAVIEALRTDSGGRLDLPTAGALPQRLDHRVPVPRAVFQRGQQHRVQVALEFLGPHK